MHIIGHHQIKDNRIIYDIYLIGPETNSSQQKKLRRKKREEKRMVGSVNKGKPVDADSSENDIDDHE